MQMLRWLKACEIQPLLRSSININIYIYHIVEIQTTIVCSTKCWRYSPAYPQVLMVVIYTTP
eukprot:SAG31_NODE_46135_length_255_cov_2.371795_1_plen_61_part_01